MEYHNHKSLKIGKIFKIKFVGLAVVNSRILFRKDCLFLGFPLGFTRFPICLDTFFWINQLVLQKCAVAYEKPRKIVIMVFHRTQVLRQKYNYFDNTISLILLFILTPILIRLSLTFLFACHKIFPLWTLTFVQPLLEIKISADLMLLSSRVTSTVLTTLFLG